jgi:hypothetical protein
MTTNTDYTKQADEFLASAATTLTATVYPGDMQSAPAWVFGNEKHGLKYRVTFRRTGKQIAFDFWDSLRNRQIIQRALDSGDIRDRIAARRAVPDAYSVLACLSSDAYCPASFDGFCDEYGYDNDSRKALATFKRCRKLAEKLMAFFTEDELAKLAEIQ